MRKSGIKVHIKFRAVRKSSPSSLDYDVELQHCFSGHNKVQIEWNIVSRHPSHLGWKSRQLRCIKMTEILQAKWTVSSLLINSNHNISDTYDIREECFSVNKEAVVTPTRRLHDTLQLRHVLGRNVVSHKLCSWLSHVCQPNLMNGWPYVYFLSPS